MSSDFKNWWDDYGSGLIRHTNHDHEQHAERVAAHAWEHRDYREAMMRGEIATLKIKNDNLRAEIAALKAERDALKAEADPLAEMWRELSEYQPQADADGHGKSWRTMCEERTQEAACAAAEQAYATEAHGEAAAWAAVDAAAAWGELAAAAVASIASIRRAKGVKP